MDTTLASMLKFATESHQALCRFLFLAYQKIPSEKRREKLPKEEICPVGPVDKLVRNRCKIVAFDICSHSS